MAGLSGKPLLSTLFAVFARRVATNRSHRVQQSPPLPRSSRQYILAHSDSESLATTAIQLRGSAYTKCNPIAAMPSPCCETCKGKTPGKNLNQVTCPDRDSNPGYLVSRPDALTVTPQKLALKEENVDLTASVVPTASAAGRPPPPTQKSASAKPPGSAHVLKVPAIAASEQAVDHVLCLHNVLAFTSLFL
ncbi:hypothetical protein ANN_13413 [Periplaneta americana]|uniref:Uncharacterized protein n=1 Tax=Periplaneta americana TaxID=6978 RepID=A0ABQ8TLC0_PERAM|nr:hypothetical protein ANN_13413 [Periplaneta americana]